MKKSGYAIAVGMFALLTMVTAKNALAAPLCIQADVKYELDIGTAGDAVIINGKRSGAAVTTFSGTGFALNGTVTIGFNSHFDFGSGTWVHPSGTALLKVSPAGAMTYDVTYHGNGGAAPINVKGNFTIIPCPVAAPPSAEPSSDPNGH